MIISSHIISDIETACEKAAVLNAGKLLFTGTVKDLAQKAAGNPASREATVENGYMEILRQSVQEVEK